MIHLTVSSEMAGMRVDKFIKEYYPQIPHGVIFKALRKKDVRINDQKITENRVLAAGDEITAYISPEYLEPSSPSSGPPLDILFEDPHLMIVNKPPGLSVHPDHKAKEGTLIQRVANHLGKQDTAFNDRSLPALCHRLDHHTGGLVIIAKTAEARTFILQIMKENRIRKFYRCLVKGNPDPPRRQVIHYFEKNPTLSQVRVLDQPQKNTVTAVTRYHTIRSGERISLLEVELLTGRTHQIRAHLAYLGHPILGDDKYGDRDLNRLYRIKTQQLWAYKIGFEGSFQGTFSYLSKRTFSVEPIPFNGLNLNQIPLTSS